MNTRAYSTLQYEIASLADSATTLVPGTACKITKLPVSPITTYSNNFYAVAACKAGDVVNGVVSLKGGITDSTDGRLVLLNAGFIPVLLNATLKKGQYVKPATSGKWDEGMAGDVVFAELMEDGAKDTLVWARPDIKTI
mgnify:CR=1 FL=1